MEVQRGPQCTYLSGWKDIVVSSLTLSVALLGCPSGTVHPTVTIMDLQGHKHDASESRPCSVNGIQECDFHVKQKLDFSCCTIVSGFRKSS